MPSSIPRRNQNTLKYGIDPPLSEFGHLSARLIGRELRHANILIKQIYCAPLLQSVETAKEIQNNFELVSYLFNFWHLYSLIKTKNAYNLKQGRFKKSKNTLRIEKKLGTNN